MKQAVTTRPVDPQYRVDIAAVRLVAVVIGMAMDRKPMLIGYLEQQTQLPIRHLCARVAADPDLAERVSVEAGKLAKSAAKMLESAPKRRARRLR